LERIGRGFWNVRNVSSQAVLSASVFQAGTLDLGVGTTTADFVPDTIGVGATSSFDAAVSDKGSVALKYEVAAEI